MVGVFVFGHFDVLDIVRVFLGSEEVFSRSLGGREEDDKVRKS